MLQPLLDIQNLSVHFRVYGGYLRVLDGVNLQVAPRETLGLVGESGSGKSTIAYTVMGMYSPTGGKVLFQGQDISVPHEKRPLSLKKELQIVFQDPGSSLNPRRSVGDILALLLSIHGKNNPGTKREKVEELLQIMGLPPEYVSKYPRSLGGGEKQMVAIARALAVEPSLVVLDEPTSALDVSVQTKIINMLVEIQNKRGLGYLFITHDLSLMRNIAHRVAIMYLGRIMELVPSRVFFEKPLHPYTRVLISSIPVVSEQEERLKPKKLSLGEKFPVRWIYPRVVFFTLVVSNGKNCAVGGNRKW